jgi:Mg-chelatase subunit ChlD
MCTRLTGRYLRVISFSCVAFVCLAGRGRVFGASGDAPKATYRSDATEVRVTFSVSDDREQAVGDIGEKDFAVVDRDRVVRNFQSFRRATWTSIDITVMLDGSGSMTGQFKSESSEARELMRRSSEIPKANFSLISFRGSAPTFICTGNCPTALADYQVPSGTTDLTPLFDSVISAASSIAKGARLHGKNVLILFSDGEDTISRNGLAEAMDAAQAHDIQIYAVDLNARPASTEGTSILRQLAKASGGRYLTLAEGAEKLLEALRDDVRAA